MDGQRDAFSYVVQRLSSGTSVIGLTGDLDGEAHSLVQQLAADELARRPAQLILELSGMTSTDCAALGVLVRVSALAAECDTSFCLVASPSDPIVGDLEAADLIERFELFGTVDEAQRHR